MGLRFRKSVRLPGGLRFNFSKRGVGASWGFKGFRVTKSPGRKTKTTHSIPGIGISYVSGGSEKSRKSSPSRSSDTARSAPSVAPREQPKSRRTFGVVAYVFEFIGAAGVPAAIIDGEPDIAIAMGIFGAVCGLAGFLLLRKKDDKNV